MTPIGIKLLWVVDKKILLSGDSVSLLIPVCIHNSWFMKSVTALNITGLE